MAMDARATMAPRTHWRITAFITIGWNRSVDVGLGEYVLAKANID